MRFNARQLRDAKSKALAAAKAARTRAVRRWALAGCLAGAGLAFAHAYHRPDDVRRGGDWVAAQAARLARPACSPEQP